MRGSVSVFIAFLAGASFLVLATSRTASAQDVTKGQKLFTEQHCVMCHSIAGKGNPKGSLDDVATKLSADEIRGWITDAKSMREKTHATRTPVMKQFDLPKDQVDALVDFLLATGKGKPAEEAAARPPAGD